MHFSLVVRDYDEAIAYYTNVIGFELVEDTPQEGKRWVVVRPVGSTETSIVLARASSSEQESRIGNQTGGRVGFFLKTDDFWRDYERLQTHNVTFRRPPRLEPYGHVTVFEDLYGNLWDLVGP